MKKYSVFIILQMMILLNSSSFSLVNNPTLPNTSSIITCFPDTNSYKVITVGATGRDFTDLQKAINSAELGTIIKIDAGAIFKGGFVLPKKSVGSGWIILMTSRMDLLPKDETRINPIGLTGNSTYPTQSSAMAKIVTTNISGIPCFVTQVNANHYRLVGLEITADTSVINSYGLVNLGDASSAQNSMSQVPEFFVIDRCYIHGHTNATVMKYGVGLNCANAAVIDSYISDFHSVGYDAQAIAGINGPGPFKIINNYLEASGENIMFGGGAAAIAGLVPSDIEVRQNYFFKPFSWRVEHPSYSGNHWTIKNLFELKTGMRVLLDGNILENSWADLPIGQSGYAILLTIRTEGGGSPQAEVSDITISNNIIRHVGAGITLSGKDDGGIGNRSKRIRIFNNLFEDINGVDYGDLNINAPNDGTFIKLGEPEDVIIDHNTIFQTGSITWAGKVMNGFVFTNNITNSKSSAAGYQGIYGPGYQQGNNTIGYYFPDVTDANQRIHKNVMIGGDASKYSNYNTLSKNYFPSNSTGVGFTNYPNGALDYHNYALLPTSQYSKSATDGKDLGVDFAMLDSSMIASRGCLPISEIKVVSLKVTPKISTIKIKDSTQITATILPLNASNKNISWSSSNQQIASVSASGLIKGITTGTATIIATSQDGNKKDSCVVTVVSNILNVLQVFLFKEHDTLYLGDNLRDTYQYTATVYPSDATNTNVSWYSLDSSIVSISQTGLARAKAIGETYIYVKTEDGGFTDSSHVTVLKPLSIDREESTSPFTFIPNPFVQQTAITFSIPKSGVARVAVYNSLGVEVTVVAEKYFEKGIHSVTWLAGGMPAGAYSCELRINGISRFGKLIHTP
ncbi:MAG: Ig-like domain-containing protein [Bacteroidetes bacterium]|nr:Ig-like domain-containing protein [Bacteroidota bacterium]